MSTADDNELLLLGLLHQRERYGYELYEHLEGELRFVTNLSRPSAYRILNKLEEQGLLKSETEQEGSRPPRHRYGLTKAGKDELEARLSTALRSSGAFMTPNNIPLLFIHELPKARAIELLEEHVRTGEARTQHLEQVIDQHPAGVIGALVVEHNLALLRAEIAWLKGLITRLKRDKKKVRSALENHAPSKRSR